MLTMRRKLQMRQHASKIYPAAKRCGVALRSQRKRPKRCIAQVVFSSFMRRCGAVEYREWIKHMHQQRVVGNL